MKKADKVLLIINSLKKEYDSAICALEYEKPYELLIACRLSAQCTDKRVNIVTKDLFKKYDTLQKFADADVLDVAEIVKPCGLYKTKAKSIVEMSGQIINDYNGELPDSIEELTKLSGVGRKTANLIMGDVYKKPAIVTDTHCIRICKRLGLSKSTEPHKVEQELLKVIPPEESSDFCHRIVQFGRDYCKARNPSCDLCPISRDFTEAGECLKCKLDSKNR